MKRQPGGRIEPAEPGGRIDSPSQEFEKTPRGRLREKRQPEPAASPREKGESTRGEG